MAGGQASRRTLLVLRAALLWRGGGQLNGVSEGVVGSRLRRAHCRECPKATSCSGAVLLGRVGCLLPAPIVPIPHPKPPLGPRLAHQLTHIRALPTRPLGLPAGIAHYQKNTSGHPEWKVKYSSSLASVHYITVNIARYSTVHIISWRIFMQNI